ncbi:MAG TPA: GNAT family protein [Mycobacteriales bacterium]|jgi:RimJ/RimL family protein N-acetyltransferase
MLTSERLTLRPLREDDLPVLYSWRIDLSTWALTTAVAPYPMTFEVFRERARKIAEEAEKNVDFVAEVDGTVAGRTGLFSFEPLTRSCEVGLWFGPEHRGQGYGREALALLTDFAFRHRNVHRVHLRTLATNEAALRCYRAAGFTEEGRLRESAWVDGQYVDEVLMSLLSTD